ncbi:DUF2726 domain-containing protein [Psychromonas aquimarina]|uniref:DUF2726 domain-containing protein n=1 Tax=Psychromonas aquimarina TaxID=444919 RepID=UPI00040EEF1A|nr:DUF2726 domain-containing protein [Psychromonas aquimarina]
MEYMTNALMKADLITTVIVILAVALFLWKVKNLLFADRYISCENLLTNAEQNFYNQLKRHIPAQFNINQKVRLADITKPTNNNIKLLHKVQAKHVDFVITEQKSSKILCAIELDDSSHLSTSAFQRDNEKNIALNSAKIPLIRIRNTRKYTEGTFRLITQHLKLSTSVINKPASIRPAQAQEIECIYCPSKTFETIKMGWPNKGLAFKRCNNCGYRTEPKKSTTRGFSNGLGT